MSSTTKNAKKSGNDVNKPNEIFIRNPFSMDKKDFGEFQTEVINAGKSHENIGGDKIDYLIPRLDAVGVAMAPLNDYNLHIIPQDMSQDGFRIQVPHQGRGRAEEREPTEAELDRNERKITKANAHNNSIRKIESAFYEIIICPICPTLAKEMQLSANVRTFWAYLETNYGLDKMDTISIGSEFVAIVSLKMGHAQRFDEYGQTLDQKGAIVGLTDAMKLGLILADGHNKAGIKGVPDRLAEARNNCITNSYGLDKCKEILRSADERQHANGLEDEKVQKSVRVVQGNLVCHNCGNDGHIAWNCKLDACGICQEFGVGHSYSRCPQRKRSVDNSKASLKAKSKSSSKKEKILLKKIKEARKPKDRDMASARRENSRKSNTKEEVLSEEADDDEEDSAENTEDSSSLPVDPNRKKGIRTVRITRYESDDSDEFRDFMQDYPEYS